MFPRLFQIGNFTLATFGILAAAGLIIALLVAIRYARRYGVDPDKTWTLGILCILAAMAGSKLLLIVTDWNYYAANPRQLFSLATLQSAGVYSGGLILGLLVAWLYIWRNHM